jgi:hypothetical protein
MSGRKPVSTINCFSDRQDGTGCSGDPCRGRITGEEAGKSEGVDRLEEGRAISELHVGRDSGYGGDRGLISMKINKEDKETVPRMTIVLRNLHKRPEDQYCITAVVNRYGFHAEGKI